MKINKYIDHTLLKPTATESQFLTLTSEAREFNFMAICVPACWVEFSQQQLKDSEVKVATVCGFPWGYTTTEQKVDEAKKMVNTKVDEIDFVSNTTWIKSKKYDLIEKEYFALRNAAPNTILKVIIESGALEKNEIKILCELAIKTKIDFVKTSTGFYEIGARIEDVKIIKECVGDKAQIKASGGIKDYKTAMSFIDAGATRIGCSSSVEIYKQAAN